MAQNPDEMAKAVRGHADAIFGRAGRALESVGRAGDRVIDLADRGAKAAKALLDRVDGKEKRRTTDIRLPNEPRRKAKRR